MQFQNYRKKKWKKVVIIKWGMKIWIPLVTNTNKKIKKKMADFFKVSVRQSIPLMQNKKQTVFVVVFALNATRRFFPDYIGLSSAADIKAWSVNTPKMSLPYPPTQQGTLYLKWLQPISDRHSNKEKKRWENI